LAVDETNGVITFTFSQPICAGTTPGTGQASRFFGLASAFPPRAVVAKVSVPGLDPIDVKATVPEQRKHWAAAACASGQGHRGDVLRRRGLSPMT